LSLLTHAIHGTCQSTYRCHSILSPLPHQHPKVQHPSCIYRTAIFCYSTEVDLYSLFIAPPRSTPHNFSGTSSIILPCFSRKSYQPATQKHSTTKERLLGTQHTNNRYAITTHPALYRRRLGHPNSPKLNTCDFC